MEYGNEFKLCDCRAKKEFRRENHNPACSLNVFKGWLELILAPAIESEAA